MPACRHCQWFQEGACTLDTPGRPLRACATGIALEYVALFQPGTRILEIGCGAWSPIHDRVAELGIAWDGIDVNTEHLGKPTIATRIASVEGIPFSTGSFDYVVANQSMEHWEEYRVPLLRGLSEVFRVLRPGGWALINVPIHLHGAPEFVLGDMPRIQAYFEPFCDAIEVEPWRAEHAPLSPIREHLVHYWAKPTLRNVSAFVLDIRARKKEGAAYFSLPPLSNWDKIVKGLRGRGVGYYVSFGLSRVTRHVRPRLRRASS